MENQRHPLVNDFFYKFYNSNIENEKILDLIDPEMYNYVASDLISFKQNEKAYRLTYLQFTLFVFNKIKLNFEDLHNNLIVAVTNINK